MKNLLISCIVSIIIVPFCAYAATDTTIQLKELAKEVAKYAAVEKDFEQKIDELKAIEEDIRIMVSQLEASGDNKHFALMDICFTLSNISDIYYYEHEFLHFVPTIVPKFRSFLYTQRINRIPVAKLRLTFHLKSLTITSTQISNKAALLEIERAKKNIRSTLKILDKITKILEEEKAKQNP